MWSPSSKQVRELGEQRWYFNEEQLKKFPQNIRVLLGNPATLKDQVLFEMVSGFAFKHSQICRILREDPTTDAVLRMVYNDKSGKSPISDTQWLDCLLSRSLYGEALRNRLEACGKWLATNFVKPKMRVMDLGGGSGSYFFEATKNTLPPGLLWFLLDTDAEALRLAENRARQSNAHRHLVPVRGNFMSAKSLPLHGQEFDAAVLIGVLCSMDKEQAVEYLSRARQYVRPEGHILSATLLQKAFLDDPLTFWLLCCVGGWQLRPKTEEEIKEIFWRAGWKVIRIFHESDDSSEQYAVVHAFNPPD